MYISLHVTYMHVTYMHIRVHLVGVAHVWIINWVINVPSALPYMEAWQGTLDILRVGYSISPLHMLP